MSKMVDLDELYTVNHLIEDALQKPVSASYIFTQKREQKILQSLQQKYHTEDLWKILYHITTVFTPAQIDGLYAIYRHIMLEYVSFDNVDEVPEFKQYQQEIDKSLDNLIQWNKLLSNELYKLHQQPDNSRFQGLLLTYSLATEDLYDCIKKAP